MAYIGGNSGCSAQDQTGEEFDLDRIIGPGLFKNINNRLEVDVGYNISIIENKLVAFASYNFTFVNTNFTPLKNRYYAVDTLGGQVTALLPSTNLINGDWIGFVDSASNFHVNSFFLNPNGKMIWRNPDLFEVDVSDAHVKLVYLNNNWFVLDESLYGSFIDSTSTINRRLLVTPFNMNFTAQLYRYHYVDTTENIITIQQPPTFTNGDWFVIIDHKATFDVNNVIIMEQPAVTIANSPNSFKMDTQRAKLKFVFFDGNWDILDVSLD